MLSKKNYVALATIFARTCPPEDCTHEEYEMWHEIRGQVLDYLQSNNPCFSREKFIDATEAQP